MPTILPNFQLFGDLNPCEGDIVSFINQNFEKIDFTKAYSVERVATLPGTAVTGDKVLLITNNNLYYWTDSWQEVISRSGMAAYDETNSVYIFFDGANWNEVGGNVTGDNVGSGSEVFKQKTGNNLELRTLVEGSNITLTQTADEIEISSTGGIVNIQEAFLNGTGVFNASTGLITGQTVFTLPFTPISEQSLFVFEANGRGVDSDEFSISGNQITFSSPPIAGTKNIYIRSIGSPVLLNVPADGSVDTDKIADSAKTDYQIKELTADISSNGVASAFTFNNLVIGNKYKVTVNLRPVMPSNDDMSVDVTDGSNEYFPIDWAKTVAASGGGTINPTFSVCKIIIATSSTLEFDFTFTGSSKIDGVGGNSWVMLEELPLHNLTTKWN